MVASLSSFLLLLTSTVWATSSSFGSQQSLGLPNTLPDFSQCTSETPTYSCENTTTIKNTCCSPTPGGLVLMVQLWDTYTGLEKMGQLLPAKSWGIHGLWPDFCNGSYTQYCDLSRQYDPAPSPNTTNGLPGGTPVPPYSGPGVDTFIKEFGRYDLLEYMNTFWINQGGPNEEFWAHEFSKHATCTSTFDLACYGPDYKKHMDVVNFYETVVRAFQMYPTYAVLQSAGIVPSNTTTYTLAQLESAVQSQIGVRPYFYCAGKAPYTILNSVYYYHHVIGSEQYGSYKPLDYAPYDSPGCNATGIWYYERTPGSERPQAQISW